MLTLNLPVYQSKLQIEKRLLTLFPKSLLAQALQEEPEAKEITLENPLVTPEVINVLNSETLLPAPKGIAQVGVYLNIPFLEFMDTREYLEFRPSVKYLRLPNKSAYQTQLEFLARHASLPLLRHLYDCIPAGTYPELDYDFFQQCVYLGEDVMMDFLLETKRVEPQYKDLVYGLRNAKTHIWDMLEGSYPRIPRDELDAFITKNYTCDNYRHIIKRLMACSSVKIAHPIDVVLSAAQTLDKVLVTWVLTQFKLTNDDYIVFMDWLEFGEWTTPEIEAMIRRALR